MLHGAFCWVISGKEIENYIPTSAVDGAFNTQVTSQVGQYDNFFDHLDMLVDGEGKYSFKKTLLAERIAPYKQEKHVRDIGC